MELSDTQKILPELMGLTSMEAGVEKIVELVSAVRCSELGIVDARCLGVQKVISGKLSIPQVLDFQLPSQNESILKDSEGVAKIKDGRQRVARADQIITAAWQLGLNQLVKLHEVLGLPGKYDEAVATDRLIQWDLTTPVWGKTTNTLLEFGVSPPWTPPVFLNALDKVLSGSPPTAATLPDAYLGLQVQWMGHWDTVILEEAMSMIVEAAIDAANEILEAPPLEAPEAPEGGTAAPGPGPGGSTGPGPGGKTTFDEEIVHGTPPKRSGAGVGMALGFAAVIAALVLGKKRR